MVAVATRILPAGRSAIAIAESSETAFKSVVTLPVPAAPKPVSSVPSAL